MTGERIADLYTALDVFADQLRARRRSDWAEGLYAAQRGAHYTGDALSRIRIALRIIATQNTKSWTSREATKLLSECDAIWRGIRRPG